MRRAKCPCVYLLASGRNGTLYVGVTSDLSNRVNLHRRSIHAGFTQRYRVNRLVYFEMHHTMPEAIKRETQLKRWNRRWKLRLIEQFNPEWRDLWDESGELSDFAPGGQTRGHDLGEAN